MFLNNLNYYFPSFTTPLYILLYYSAITLVDKFSNLISLDKEFPTPIFNISYKQPNSKEDHQDSALPSKKRKATVSSKDKDTEENAEELITLPLVMRKYNKITQKIIETSNSISEDNVENHIFSVYILDIESIKERNINLNTSSFPCNIWLWIHDSLNTYSEDILQVPLLAGFPTDLFIQIKGSQTPPASSNFTMDVVSFQKYTFTIDFKDKFGNLALLTIVKKVKIEITAERRINGKIYSFTFFSNKKVQKSQLDLPVDIQSVNAKFLSLSNQNSNQDLLTNTDETPMDIDMNSSLTDENIIFTIKSFYVKNDETDDNYETEIEINGATLICNITKTKIIKRLDIAMHHDRNQVVHKIQELHQASQLDDSNDDMESFETSVDQGLPYIALMLRTENGEIHNTTIDSVEFTIHFTSAKDKKKSTISILEFFQRATMDDNGFIIIQPIEGTIPKLSVGTIHFTARYEETRPEILLILNNHKHEVHYFYFIILLYLIHTPKIVKLMIFLSTYIYIYLYTRLREILIFRSIQGLLKN